MKKFKYFTIFTITLTALIISYKYQYHQKKTLAVWQTYEQKNREVKKHVSTKKELKAAKINPAPARAPASLNKNIKKVGRVETDAFKEKYSTSKQKVKYTNTPSKEWKDKFAKNKLQYYPEGTKLLIKHKSSLIDVTKDGARYLERVVVNVIKEDSPPISYEAFVDSQSGDQVKAWNRTHHENANKTLFIKKL